MIALFRPAQKIAVMPSAKQPRAKPFFHFTRAFWAAFWVVWVAPRAYFYIQDSSIPASSVKLS
jgi:hypothetical protein